MESTKTQITNVLQLRRGDHICYPTEAFRPFYHHAIVTAVNSLQSVFVVQVAGSLRGSYGSSGSMTINSSTMIRHDDVDLSKLAFEGNLYRVDYKNDENLYPPEAVALRAESAIGWLSNYHWLKNNCEHFATLCKSGVGFSTQSGV